MELKKLDRIQKPKTPRGSLELAESASGKPKSCFPAFIYGAENIGYIQNLAKKDQVYETAAATALLNRAIEVLRLNPEKTLDDLDDTLFGRFRKMP